MRNDMKTLECIPLSKILCYTEYLTIWGCTGFDRVIEGLGACQGWSAGLVKSRPNSFDSNVEYAMAA
jgi:hypothetical protein